MIDDEQTKKLAETQVFQWASLKLMIVRDGKLLMGRRLDADDYGLFEFPGGKPEVGEGVWEAVAREAREEVGLELIQPVELKPVLVRQNNQKNILFFIVTAEASSGEPISEMEELDQIKFYSPEELKIMLGQNQIRLSFVDAVKMFLAGEVQVG